MIFNIQRFSTHDGNGIRTLIFYKGCPLRCQWCSNPESQSFESEIMYNKKNCKNFGDCLTASNAISKSKNGISINRKQLKNPEMLKNICISKAMTVVGEKKSVGELLTEIDKDLLFYNEDGGVTLSGGEPLSQGDDLVELLKQLKSKNININMETTLHVKWERVERCLGLVNTFLVDLKHINTYKFKKYTKGNSQLVINNLIKLDETSEEYIIRIPVISEFNHSEKEMKEIIDFVASLKNAKEIHFLAYHTFGVEKYKMLGVKYPFSKVKNVEEKELTPYIKYAQTLGLKTKIGG